MKTLYVFIGITNFTMNTNFFLALKVNKPLFLYNNVIIFMFGSVNKIDDTEIFESKVEFKTAYQRESTIAT